MGYRIVKQREGCYYVLDTEDGERMARVARFMPGPMVLLESSSITSPGLAKAIARAMTRLANDIEKAS